MLRLRGVLIIILSPRKYSVVWICSVIAAYSAVDAGVTKMV